MKLIFSFLLLVTATFVQAKPQVVFPSVFTFPNQVQVNVYNNTLSDIWCTGTLFIRKQSGATQTEFYSERVYRGMNSMRHFYNRTIRDRFVFTSHTISCH